MKSYQQSNVYNLTCKNVDILSYSQSYPHYPHPVDKKNVEK